MPSWYTCMLDEYNDIYFNIVIESRYCATIALVTNNNLLHIRFIFSITVEYVPFMGYVYLIYLSIQHNVIEGLCSFFFICMTLHPNCESCIIITFIRLCKRWVQHHVMYFFCLDNAHKFNDQKISVFPSFSPSFSTFLLRQKF